MVVFRQKWLYSGKKWLFLVKSGCSLAKGLYSAKVVVFGQKWLYSSKLCLIRAKYLYSSKSCCIRTKWL